MSGRGAWLCGGEAGDTMNPDKRMNQTTVKPDQLMGWMQSLADDTRLRLLRLLERNELGVAELCAVLQMPQSTVSRHLKVLADQGWVKHDRRGTTNLYRMIVDELSGPAGRLWDVAREQTEGWATGKQDRLRLERVLREREQDAQTFFAGAAGDWDKLRGELYGERFSFEAMLALLPKEYVVADLGCGTGLLLAELAPHVKRVIGVDASEAMLKAAEKRLSGLGNVELRQGDLSSLPMDEAACDAALCVLALTYVDDPAACVREMGRVLKPGRTCVVVDLLPHDRDDFRRQMGQKTLGLGERTIDRLFEGAGLIETQFRPLSPEPGAKGPALFVATATRISHA